jgi:predicted ester cyclase
VCADDRASDHVAAIERYYKDVWERGEMATLDELFRREFAGHDPIGGDFDLDGLRRLAIQYRTGFPDYRLYVDDTIAIGDWVAARWHSEGTFTGEVIGLKPNGRMVENTGIVIYRFEGARVAELWNAWDTLGFMRQLGALQAQA